MMQLVIKTATSRKINLDVRYLATIEDVKGKIYIKEGIPPPHQYIFSEDQQLADNIQLDESNSRDLRLVNTRSTASNYYLSIIVKGPRHTIHDGLHHLFHPLIQLGPDGSEVFLSGKKTTPFEKITRAYCKKVQDHYHHRPQSLVKCLQTLTIQLTLRKRLTSILCIVMHLGGRGEHR
jgi:hypothetical protein